MNREWFSMEYFMEIVVLVDQMVNIKQLAYSWIRLLLIQSVIGRIKNKLNIGN